MTQDFATMKQVFEAAKVEGTVMWGILPIRLNFAGYLEYFCTGGWRGLLCSAATIDPAQYHRVKLAAKPEPQRIPPLPETAWGLRVLPVDDEHIRTVEVPTEGCRGLSAAARYRPFAGLLVRTPDGRAWSCAYERILNKSYMYSCDLSAHWAVLGSDGTWRLSGPEAMEAQLCPISAVLWRVEK